MQTQVLFVRCNCSVNLVLPFRILSMICFYFPFLLKPEVTFIRASCIYIMFLFFNCSLSCLLSMILLSSFLLILPSVFSIASIMQLVNVPSFLFLSLHLYWKISCIWWSKTDGAGGKGTWGRWLDTDGESHIDKNDPNYDSGEVSFATYSNILLK